MIGKKKDRPFSIFFSQKIMVLEKLHINTSLMFSVYACEMLVGNRFSIFFGVKLHQSPRKSYCDHRRMSFQIRVLSSHLSSNQPVIEAMIPISFHRRVYLTHGFYPFKFWLLSRLRGQALHFSDIFDIYPNTGYYFFLSSPKWMNRVDA